jgi:hypothetical protein
MSTPETIYYQDESIIITNARAVLGSKTYAMANITSVSMGVIPANRMPGIVLAAIGGLSTLCCGCSALAPLSTLGYSNNGDSSGIIGNAVFAGIGAIIGLLFVAGGIALAIMSKPTYVVKIGSASGEANALTSQNKSYIAGIVTAMNEAIIKRG